MQCVLRWLLLWTTGLQSHWGPYVEHASELSHWNSEELRLFFTPAHHSLRLLCRDNYVIDTLACSLWFAHAPAARDGGLAARSCGM